jgi:ribose/xylose/arabinose/galactoside ABC-type transport system permease subunit
VLGVAALGTTCVLVAGGLDLSIGSLAALASVCSRASSERRRGARGRDPDRPRDGALLGLPAGRVVVAFVSSLSS